MNKTNNARKEFCEQTIVRIEVKIGELLSWINQNSSNEQDEQVANTIKSLAAVRRTLLAELEDREDYE